VSKRLGIGSFCAWLGLFLFFYAPLLSLLILSMTQSSFWESIVAPSTLQIVWLTFFQSSLSTFFALILGIPLGLWIASEPRKLNAFILQILQVPLIVPSLMAALVWLKMGVGFGLIPVILAHTTFNIPLVAYFVARRLLHRDPRALLSAQSLGASRWNQFRFVTWPEMKPALQVATLVTFGFCATSFALVLLLGGGAPTETLEVGIYSSVRRGPSLWPPASALALWQVLLCFLPFWFLRRLDLSFEPQVTLPAVKYGWAPLITVLALSGFYFIPLLISPPFLALKALIEPMRAATLQSLIVALPVGMISTLSGLSLVILARRSSWLHSLCIGLGGVSPMVFALAIWMWWNQFIPSLTFSLLGLILAQSILFMPFAYRFLASQSSRSFERQALAAASLGASPWQSFWWVESRYWIAPFRQTLALMAAFSLGEFAISSFFSIGENMGLSVLLGRLLAQHKIAEAQAVLLVLTMISVLILGLGQISRRRSALV
jgi:thiamine transport system permease protein